MPVTITGDATKRIEALVSNLSDENMRDLTIQLRDSLVRRLWNVQWKGGPSVYIGRGLTAYTEPVRTPTGGWMCGVGSLDILHREDAPPRTITEFLEWYRTEIERGRVERREIRERKAAEKRVARVRIESIRSLEQRYTSLDAALRKLLKRSETIDRQIHMLLEKIANRKLMPPSAASDRMIDRWEGRIRDLRIESSELVARRDRIRRRQADIDATIRVQWGGE